MRAVGVSLPSIPTSFPPVVGSYPPHEYRGAAVGQSGPQQILPTSVNVADVAAAMDGFYACSAQQKFERAERMLEASEYIVLPPPELGQPFRFTNKLLDIQTVPFLDPTAEDKPAHRVGVAGVVTFSVFGDPPEVFRNAQYGVVRIGGAGRSLHITGPGPATDPALALAVFRDGPQVDTRVFGVHGRSQFANCLSQEIIGISAADEEGPLVIDVPDPLAQVDVGAPEDCRVVLGRFAPGTVLGTVHSADGDPSWGVTIVLAGRLRSSEVADRHWHFRHKLHPVTLQARIFFGMMVGVQKILSWF